ncbi:hypothetical protein J8273_0663 [Carpediemonas membranifera]|uniref:Uncharacterized protein n=1 Tax=Carpediemonas membranifera TaxID=201153 RepID=A0A8J6B816_9EUKA|nr:hypothetical protein J8273_0663 [Carpediemonas membranifera]|eukprot:KAG9397533.1 hypothetical protein J8273_0663 [Carpediemonas membranifera]
MSSDVQFVRQARTCSRDNSHMSSHDLQILRKRIATLIDGGYKPKQVASILQLSPELSEALINPKKAKKYMKKRHTLTYQSFTTSCGVRIAFDTSDITTAVEEIVDMDSRSVSEMEEDSPRMLADVSSAVLPNTPIHHTPLSHQARTTQSPRASHMRQHQSQKGKHGAGPLTLNPLTAARQAKRRVERKVMGVIDHLLGLDD